MSVRIGSRAAVTTVRTTQEAMSVTAVQDTYSTQMAVAAMVSVRERERVCVCVYLLHEVCEESLHGVVVWPGELLHQILHRLNTLSVIWEFYAHTHTHTHT